MAGACACTSEHCLRCVLLLTEMWLPAGTALHTHARTHAQRTHREGFDAAELKLESWMFSKVDYIYYLCLEKVIKFNINSSANGIKVKKYTKILQETCSSLLLFFFFTTENLHNSWTKDDSCVSLGLACSAPCRSENAFNCSLECNHKVAQ